MQGLKVVGQSLPDSPRSSLGNVIGIWNVTIQQLWTSERFKQAEPCGLGIRIPGLGSIRFRGSGALGLGAEVSTAQKTSLCLYP